MSMMEIKKIFILSFVAIFQWIGLSLAKSSGVEIIDLSHSFHNNTVRYPFHKPFISTTIVEGYSEEFKLWLYMRNYEGAEHVGTHMDAPSHFVPGMWDVDDIPLERFVYPAVVINITQRAMQNPDAEVTVDDLLEWEEKYGEIPDGAGIFMHSSWALRLPDMERYLGNDDGDTANLHYPGFSFESSKWLTENRNIWVMGVDTPSPDVGPSTLFPVHIEILGRNIMIIENMVNLDKLPPSGATIHAFPMKIKDGSGAPIRMLAYVSDRPDPLPPNSGIRITAALTTLMSTVLLFLLV